MSDISGLGLETSTGLSFENMLINHPKRYNVDIILSQ